MNQCLHIFRKDVRFLYREIALMLVLAAVFSRAEFLLMLAQLFVIARLVHAESVSGDRQFWLTRPYSRQSLLFAKLLFISIFVCAPVGLAQLVTVTTSGFSVAHELPGFVWSQVLLFFGAMLVMALASVTSGLVPFMLAAMSVIAAGILSQFVPLRIASHSHGLWPAGVEWIRSAFLGAGLAVIATFSVLTQYRRRETSRTIIGGLVGLALVGGLAFSMPPSWALNAQTWFSKSPSAGTPVQASIGKIHLTKVWEILDSRSLNVRLIVPLNLSGVPQGRNVVVDGLEMTLEWPGKPAWTSGVAGANPRPEGNAFESTVLLTQTLFQSNRNLPMTAHATLFLTLFGPESARVIPLMGSTAVQDGLRCGPEDLPRMSSSWSDPRNLFCQSFFRWPARLVYANSGKGEMDFNNLISYSPFPAAFGINPGEGHGASLLSSAKTATIITKEPLAHFRRDSEVSGIRLADLRN
jgi:ABC-type transport system involved in multi-copper enzyme maturation permease subunit